MVSTSVANFGLKSQHSHSENIATMSKRNAVTTSHFGALKTLSRLCLITFQRRLTSLILHSVKVV